MILIQLSLGRSFELESIESIEPLTRDPEAGGPFPTQSITIKTAHGERTANVWAFRLRSRTGKEWTITLEDYAAIYKVISDVGAWRP